MTAPHTQDDIVQLEEHRQETQGRLDEIKDAHAQLEHMEQQAPVAQRHPGGFLRGFMRITGAVAKIVAQTLVPQQIQRAYSAGRTAFDAVRHHDLKGGAVSLVGGAAEFAGQHDPHLAANLHTAQSIIDGRMSEDAAKSLTGAAFKRGVLEGLVGATASVVGRRGDGAVPPAPDTESIAGVPAAAAAVPDATPPAREQHADDELHDDDIVEVHSIQYEHAHALRESLVQERMRLEAIIAETQSRIAALEHELTEADSAPTAPAVHDDHAHPDEHDGTIHPVGADVGMEREPHLTIAEAHAAGVPASELRGHHAVAEFHGVYSAADLHGVFTAAELHGVYTAEELHGVYSASDLHGAYSAHELHGVYDARELAGVFSPSELRGVYSAEELHGAYSGHDLAGVYPARELHGVFEAAELAGAYSAADLHYGGFSAAELLHGGFDVHDLAHAGFDLSDLKEAGISVSELRDLFSLHDLAKVFDAHELEHAFDRRELAAEGLVEDDQSY